MIYENTNNRFLVIEVSKKLIEVVNIYKELTLSVARILDKEISEINVEEVNEINQILSKRAETIAIYEKTRAEYDKLMDLSGPNKKEGVVVNIEATIKGTFSSLYDIELKVMKRLEKLSSSIGSSIKELEEGKVLFNTYNDSMATPDGVFFDKRT